MGRINVKVLSRNSVKVIAALAAIMALGAASTAQASGPTWHYYTDHIEMNSGARGGGLELTIPSKNARITCTISSVWDTATLPTALKTNFSNIKSCRPYNLKTGAEIKFCPEVYEGPERNMAFEGTGAAVAMVGEPLVIQWGPECGIGVKVKVSISNLAFSYSLPNEAWIHEVTGEGTATYGAVAATVAFYSKLQDFHGLPWGWY